MEQSYEPLLDNTGITFVAYVIKQSKQLILVLRESITAYTSVYLIADINHDTLL